MIRARTLLNPANNNFNKPYDFNNISGELYATLTSFNGKLYGGYRQEVDLANNIKHLNFDPANNGFCS